MISCFKEEEEEKLFSVEQFSSNARLGADFVIGTIFQATSDDEI